jgi:hypothetical protein
MLLGDFSEYMKALDSFLKKKLWLQMWMAINLQNSELLLIIFYFKISSSTEKENGRNQHVGRTHLKYLRNQQGYRKVLTN